MENKKERFFVELIKENLNGITAFIEQLLTFDGKVNFQYLHKVKEGKNKIEIMRCSERDKNNDYAILIGGEVPNSFCPLYEAAYFFQALFLSAIGTVYLNKYSALGGNTNIKDLLRNKIIDNVLNITEDEMLVAIKKPSINIICSLDTDIESYRYVKHQLWRLDEGALKKRCSEIKKSDFGKENLDYDLRNIYWIGEDMEIAEEAMKHAETLPQAKVIQYYITMKKILKKLGLDVSKIPWYFNFVPKEEILLLGPDNEFLKTVIALHEKNARKIISKITKTDHPWIISLACPKCFESSKKIIRATLRSDCKTVHLFCSRHPQEFRNELGTKIVRKGCGYSWNFEVPENSKQLYNLFKTESPTLNFAVRYLLAVIKTTADCPVCWPVTDLGITKENENYIVVNKLPKGYGDHRNLLTSVLVMQYLFVGGILIPKFSQKLIQRQILTSKEMQILAWTSKNKLYDPEVFCLDNKEIHVTDTSVLKALKKGISPLDLFKNSININNIKLEQLLNIQNRNLSDILDII